MSNDDKRVTRGRFAGKKITFASTERIEDFGQLASDFMGQVFDFLPDEYLISDESDLLDFTDMGSSDTSEIWKRITEVYGVSPVDVESERLVTSGACAVHKSGASWRWPTSTGVGPSSVTRPPSRT